MRNNYKESLFNFSMERGFNKKGQIAIFVIIALVIVTVILFFLLYPKIKSATAGATSPEEFLRQCIEPTVKPVVETLSKQGGYMNPEGFVLYNDTKIKYLCYSSEYYKTCMVQQPNIIGEFEKELYGQIEPKIKECYQNLINDYESKGYSVSSVNPKTSLQIVPGSIRVSINSPITVTKEASQTFKGFDVNIQSEMYNLLMTATTVIDFESTYGNSETTMFLQYYPDLKMEKIKLSDGTAIYKLTNVVSGESFVFASRSVVWPPGYLG